MIILWGSTLFSAIFDNIPFVIAMIQRVFIGMLYLWLKYF
jgi:Na+/H+ antiporter NhaD/arsenite permease-like protein